MGEPAGELLHLADAVAVALVAGDLAGGFDGGGSGGFGGLFEGDLVDQHLEVGADHAVAVVVGGVVVGADAGGLFGGGVLGDLAEDPWIRGSGAADHDGVAVGGVDHGGGVFGGADVSITDDRDVYGVLDGGDVLPAGLAGVAVFAGAGVEGAGVEAAVFGHLREVDADDVLVVPAHAELYGERDGDRAADGLEDALDLREIAQEAGATVAGDDALGGAAEVEVYEVEACVLNDAGRVGEGIGVGAEELGGDGVLVVVVGEVALALGLAHAGETVGGGELRHDEAAAGLLIGLRGLDVGAGGFSCELAGVFDEAAEDGVGDASHGCEDGGGGDFDVAYGEAGRDAGVLGHGMLGGRVPAFLLQCVALLHRS